MTSISRYATMALAAGLLLGLMALPSAAAEEIKPGQPRRSKKSSRTYCLSIAMSMVSAVICGTWA